MGSHDERTVRERLRRQFQDDRAWGRMRTTRGYQALFPGHEAVVADELRKLRTAAQKTRRPNTPQTPRAEPPAAERRPEPSPSAVSSAKGAGTDGSDERVGPYRVIRELGRGGQATVYLAEDTRLSRKVALKVLPRDFDPAGTKLRRFHREAEIASSLDHPGICTIYEAGEADGTAFIAMRYVAGETLQGRLDRAQGKAPGAPADEELDAPTLEGKASPPPSSRDEIVDVLALIEKAARALHVAHEAGLIHRDIKPGNIMVTEGGEPVLLDFGLAREQESDEATLTATGALLGTPAYMSPEQLQPDRMDTDRRTDVYSLGVTLYECLTLRLPFEAPTRMQLFQRILSSSPDLPRRLNPAIPADLDVVLQTAIEKDRDRRYQTAEAFADDLRRVRKNEPIRAKPVGALVRFDRWVRRNPALAASVGGLFLALAAGLLVSLNLLGRTRSALADAEEAKGQSVRAHEKTKQALAAEHEALRRNRALALATAAAVAEKEDPMRSLLLAREAGREQLLPQVVAQLSSSIHASLERATIHHSAPVGTAVYSHDATLIVTACRDGTARVWDRDGNELAVLRGHTKLLRGAAFSPDGGKVVTWSADGTARLWELDGDELVVLRGHRKLVTRAAFNPAGDRIVTSSHDKTARLWDLDGRELAVFRGHERNLHRVAFTSGGNGIVTASSDGTARLWDLEGTSLAVLAGHRGPIWDMAVSGSGERVLTAGEDGTVRLWDLAGNQLAVVADHGSAPVRTVAFSPDDARVVTGGDDGTAGVWSLEGERLFLCQGHLAPLLDVVFSPDGTSVLTASRDATARLWNADGHEVVAFRGHKGDVASAVFSLSGNRVLTASADGTARVWNAQGSNPRGDAVLRGHGFALTSAVFSPDGTRIVTASMDGTARLWDRSGTRLALLRGHRTWVVSAVFSPAGDRILTAAGNVSAQAIAGTARLWDLEGNEVAVFRGHEKGLTAAMFTPAGDGVLTVSFDRTARLWDLEGNEQRVVARTKHAIAGASFTPAGDGVLVALVTGNLELYDLSGRKQRVFRGHTEAALRPVFSPAGDTFLSPSFDRTVRLWDLEGRTLAVLRGHENWVLSAEFSRDGKQILTASADSTARLWDLDGNVTGVLRGHRRGVMSAMFSPSGDRILTSSGDFTARLWLVRGEDLLALAEQRVTREFTFDERQRYVDFLGADNARILGAHSLVNELAARWLLPADVTSHIREDASLTADFRALALAAAAELPRPTSTDLNSASWRVVEDPERDAQDYRWAVRAAEEAVRLSPGDSLVLNTLGVAQFRAGAYADAVATLERCDAVNSAGSRPGSSADLAFLAMAYHHLGDEAAAQGCLARLKALLDGPRGASDEEGQGFLREALELLAPDTGR